MALALLSDSEKAAFGRDRLDRMSKPSKPLKRVDEAGLESLPATDSPSWTSGVERHPAVGRRRTAT
jgi:hypothetical protein